MTIGDFILTGLPLKDGILDLLLDRPNEGAAIAHLARMLNKPDTDVHSELLELQIGRLVTRVERLHGSAWVLTSHGITNASAARSIRARQHEAEAPGPMRVTMCNAPEVPAPSRAKVCIDEADLDDWWDDLDVELKSAAFLNYSFGSARSGVDVSISEPAVSVPIVGEEWNAMAGRLNGLPQTTLCYWCHLAAPGVLFLREAEISAHGSVLRRVCSDGDCMARWHADYLAMGATIARGEDLQGESLNARITLQDAERAGD